MNTPLPPDHHGALPGEGELAALYRKLPRHEPPAALDAAVLRAAADALRDAGTSSARGATARTRWLIPLSSAATLVLAAGLAWHMRTMPAAETSSMQAASPAAVASNTAVAAPAPAPQSDQSVSSAPTPAVASASAQGLIAAEPASTSEKAPLEHRAVLPLSTRAASRLSKPITPNLIAKAYKPDRSTPDGSRPDGSTPDAGTSDQQPAADAATTDQSQNAARLTKRLRETDSSAASHDMVAGRYTAQSSPAAAPIERETLAAPMAAAPAPAAPPAQDNMADTPASSDEVSDKDTAGVAARMAPSVAAKAEFFPATTRDEHDTAAQELVKIRLLLAQHRDDEAQARLRAFDREYPQQPLPDDLRGRLSQQP